VAGGLWRVCGLIEREGELQGRPFGFAQGKKAARLPPKCRRTRKHPPLQRQRPL